MGPAIRRCLSDSSVRRGRLRHLITQKNGLERCWFSEIFCGDCDVKFRIGSRRLVRWFRCPDCGERCPTALLGSTHPPDHRSCLPLKAEILYSRRQNMEISSTCFQSDVENAELIGFVLQLRLHRDMSPRRKPHFCGFLESPAVFPKPNQVVYAFSLRSEVSCPYPLSAGESDEPAHLSTACPRV